MLLWKVLFRFGFYVCSVAFVVAYLVTAWKMIAAFPADPKSPEFREIGWWLFVELALIVCAFVCNVLEWWYDQCFFDQKKG